MSTKHFFADTTGVVALGLESLVARNTNLAADLANKVIWKKLHDSSKVSIISGGGAGHEPAWSGYVGDGMLAASVSGEVFASPSTKQIMAAISKVPSEAGIILCITNYTGDNLHFGLAREKATGLGFKIGMLRMSEDVGLGRKQTENTGRRGLAGNMFVLKLCGSASEKGYKFEDCMKIGQSVNDNCGTIGSSLDYCHIPGRTHHEHLPADTYSVAQGIHNEPGLVELSPIPQPEELVAQMLRYLLDPSDKDRAFVPFDSSDETCLLINNFGGMSNLETEALTTVTMKILERDWSIKPKRSFVQCFETSLNAPGWSISLINFTGIGKETEMPTSTLFELLDLETNAPAWPRNGYIHPRKQLTSPSSKFAAATEASKSGPKVDATSFQHALTLACDDTIAAEPDITKWDIQTGDGDCGEAVLAILTSIKQKLSNEVFSSGNLFNSLDEISESIEDVGGTLGAIVAIMVASFTSSLRTAYTRSTDSSSYSVSIAEVSQAASEALQNLQTYTGARIGGRTVMDTLIPFVEELERSKDVGKAAQAGEDGARKTEGMTAKFGRASYLGEKQDSKDIPMDPGAWAAAVFLKGLAKGYE